MANETNQLFKTLKNYHQFEKTHNSVLAVLEGVFALIGGGYFGSYLSTHKTHEIIIFLICFVLFIYLFYRRVTRDSFFPLSAIGELHSTVELDAARKDVARKQLIDTYIDDAVRALNTNTCNYNDNNVLNFLCDTSIEDGLQSVFQPFFTNPQNLLDSPRAKFTVGAWLSDVFRLPRELGVKVCPLEHGPQMLIPRDDLLLSAYIQNASLENSGQEGLSFHLWTILLDSYRHGKFIVTDIAHEGRHYTLISLPVPTVCEDGNIGVFFLLAERIDNIPVDLDNVSQIFSRLFSNWLVKYNECVIQRTEKTNLELENAKKIAQYVPPEVV